MCTVNLAATNGGPRAATPDVLGHGKAFGPCWAPARAAGNMRQQIVEMLQMRLLRREGSRINVSQPSQQKKAGTSSSVVRTVAQLRRHEQANR
ncbi:hypothetical protein OPT61_g8066 [Boeremia exigua]|uniref:Uncharacterized protein n=1 Tax=Boeremia exigua TaxID=749465 RepID=A0ACC2I053_9PLEO|nr:hypothetical protein OPT61_g8066 [Boeremia exigua]